MGKRFNPMKIGLLALVVGLIAFYFYSQNRVPEDVVSMGDPTDSTNSFASVASLATSVISMFASVGCFLFAFIDYRSKRKE